MFIEPASGLKTAGARPALASLTCAALVLALTPPSALAQNSPSSPPGSGAETPLPAVTVNAAAESATGPVSGYIAKRSATATKTDTPLVETPQSVSIVGAEQIETMKAQRLQDVLAYSAGIGVTEGYDHTTDSFVMRGFQAYAGVGSVYRDGSRYLVNVYDGTQEPYGLERVEVLKGAASVLYGSAAPGGIINTVTKRPTAQPFRELNLELGNWRRRQVSADFGGPVGADGTWAYRLTALARDSDTMVDHVGDDRTYLAPALRWQPNGSTSLTLLAHYQRSRTAYVYGLPAEGTLLGNANGRIPTHRFIGEPGYDKFDNTLKSAGYLFEHAFSDALKLRHSLRAFDSVGEFPSVWIYGLAADGRTTAERGAQDRTDRSAALSSDTSLEFKATTGAVVHTLLAGLDLTRDRFETERYDRPLANLDLYAPVYGARPGPRVPAAFSWKSRSQRTGVYLQDQLKIDQRWVVLLGARHDRVRSRERLLFDPAAGWDEEDSDATTGRAGLVYLVPYGLAPFVSVSQSFEPQGGYDWRGERLKPTRGQQFEAGLRWQPEGNETQISAALYQLTQSNVLSTYVNPANPGVGLVRQTGEVRSRGFELEARTRIARRANVIAAYAYTDARTTRSEVPAEIGRRSGGVPYNQASVWADLDFGGFGHPDLAALKAGLGVRHVGSTMGIFMDAQVPGYTVFDAMLGWQSGPWRLAVNVSNLADKIYVGSCTYDCFYGERRKLIGSASYRW